MENSHDSDDEMTSSRLDVQVYIGLVFMLGIWEPGYCLFIIG